MHLAGYTPPPRRRGGWAAIREDVHLHAAAAEVRALVADPTAYRAWLPEAIQDFRADTEGVAFALALPGRREAVSVRRVATEDPREVVFRMDDGGVVDTLHWGLHVEGQRECHVTLEVIYRPADGFLGGAMETLMHRGQRTQVLRDLLWNMKRAIERAQGAAEVAGA